MTLADKSDIVKRLREAYPSAGDYTETTYNKLLLREAADEIERLQAAQGLARVFSGVGLIGALEAENTRLREALHNTLMSLEHWYGKAHPGEMRHPAAKGSVIGEARRLLGRDP